MLSTSGRLKSSAPELAAGIKLISDGRLETGGRRGVMNMKTTPHSRDRLVLRLHLKGEYFNAIKAGTKLEEYRLVNPHWEKRLVGRVYDDVEFCLGYPKKGDSTRRILLPYRGYKIKRITHKHFGGNEVEVFAIQIAEMGER